MKLRSPAAQRNSAPIADVLARWLPLEGMVLEVASGGGEHALTFSRLFPDLRWQPSDPDSAALASIASWREEEGRPNLLPPIRLDAGEARWPVEQADAIVAINLVHISSWSVSLGLLAGAGRLLPPNGALILYGPWRNGTEPLEPSNQEFDHSLRSRDPAWGIREIGSFAEAAQNHGLELVEQRLMPANNRMLLFRRARGAD